MPEDLDELLGQLTQTFNALSEEFIRFSLAYVRMKTRLEELKGDQPTLFNH